MIQANELRIGNIVKPIISRFNEKYLIIESISFDEINMNFRPYRLDSIEPIPLTEEWLLKLGFTKHHADYFNDVIYIKNVPNNNEFEWGLYPNKIGSGIQVKNGKLLKYVHQLQNLYFSLTGEELTIN